MTDDLKQMQGQAVDLNAAHVEALKQRAAEEQQAAVVVSRWTRAMRRTFKGILPHSQRRIALRTMLRNDVREDAERAAREAGKPEDEVRRIGHNAVRQHIISQERGA